MTRPTPRNVDEYLERLRDEMRGDDPALVQDALYDAEEYLRAELAQQPGRPVSEVIADIVTSYGAPGEVAAAYRQTERTVSQALRAPAPASPETALGVIFGVFADPRSYATIIYMLLTLATGIIYFVTVAVGLSLSLGLAITLIGIPVFLLFVGIVRLFSLLEGRIVETMLAVRMPRRPLYPEPDDGIFARIGRMLTDVRTWSTMLYMVLMLPLGIFYFTLTVTGFSASLAALLAPVGWGIGRHYFHFSDHLVTSFWGAGLVCIAGFAGLVAMMHLCRFIGSLHGQLAKYLLVRQRVHD